MKLYELADVIRSKNSGPYELTFDMIFKSKDIFEALRKNNEITKSAFAYQYGIQEKDVLSIIWSPPSNALKVTIKRPLGSGDLGDKDIYGAQQHVPLLDWELYYEEVANTQLAGKNGKKIVLGVIGADVHSVGNKILDYAISEAGFEVTNLGVMVTQEEFINAAIETEADAILVSSLYGHGELDCRGLREKCVEAGLENILLYVGGNLVVGKVDLQEVEQRYVEMGFDRVYSNRSKASDCIRDLKKDLEIT